MKYHLMRNKMTEEQEAKRMAEVIKRIETKPRMAFKKDCTVMPIDRGE